MIEEFKEDGWHDFQARYQGTYGWYEKANGSKLLVTLLEVNATACKFVDAEGAVFTALSDKGNNFQFIPVKRGIYRTRAGLVYCRRVPAKQYKRGIAQGNTYLEHIPSCRPVKLTFDIVADMFGEGQVFPAEIVSEEKDSFLYNNAFALAGGLVWLYNNPIGSYKGKEIVLHADLFKQEIEDMLNAVGLHDHKVSVA